MVELDLELLPLVFVDVVLLDALENQELALAPDAVDLRGFSGAVTGIWLESYSCHVLPLIVHAAPAD